MNKRALLDYALYARKELETQIALSLNKIGIFKDHIAEAHIVGDYCIVDGVKESFPKNLYESRRAMIAIHLQNSDFDDVVEEFAYTWFNRIIAIRFMEVHDYFDHGFRVLTSRDGSYEPEILKNLPYVSKDLRLSEKQIKEYQDQNKTDELFRYVLFKQCNALSEILPLLFDDEGSYLELVLPANLLAQDSIVRKITDIPEEDFMNDVEVVGWLYQFYNSVKKDEVFASKKTITKDTLPAVTQLFTPDWIVRYMADNSIGRIWMESYPDSPLKQELKYYVDDAEQEPEVQKKLEEIRYKNVDPQNITIIEPCCGSGHILVYAFDLLYKMYLEKGYDKKDIPGYILGKNLFGLDVDRRAAQLAQFSLIMKARTIDARFFNKDRYARPMIYDIKDTQSLSKDYRDLMRTYGFSKEAISQAYELEQLFIDARVIGSLLKIEDKNFSRLSQEITKVKSEAQPGLFDWYFFDHDLPLMYYLCSLANILSIKYDVMITNPPYISYSKLENSCKEYVVNEYSISKSDMFAMFMEVDLVKNSGYRAMINMQGWMFLSSFEDLRRYLVDNKLIQNMLHLGSHAFDMIGGEVVNTTSFIIRNAKIEEYNSNYFQLNSYDSSQKKSDNFINKTCKKFTVKQEQFKEFPGYQIAYWVSDNVRSIFKNEKMDKYYFSDGRNITGDNNKYLRYHWEVELNKIGRNKKWLNYVKGGGYRKWYGNIIDVVDWSEEARAFYHKNSSSRIIAEYLWYKTGITWNLISSGTGCFRIMTGDNTFDMGGPSVFPKDAKIDLIYTLAYLNSKVVSLLNSVVNQTINYQVEHILSTPIMFDDKHKNEIGELCYQNIDLAKKDWDSFEISRDFIYHPLCFSGMKKISDSFSKWDNDSSIRFKQMKENEEKINELFINIYNLESELDPFVSDESISIRLSDKKREVRSLISYLVGLLMGRYSLSQEGLVYAGGKFDKTKYDDYVDEDGIVPIYSYIGINGGLIDEICKLIKRIYGEEYYQDNLDFVAEALDRKSNESAEEAINRYLNDDFYNDHLKIYQKRPIYWMLSSGKQGAFKCLIYLHRYNKDTLGLINSKYFLPRTALYKTERDRLETRLATGQLDAREKRNVENELEKVVKCEEELLEYGQVLDHLANQYIELDLDDGVKENYVKFQGVTLQVNGATIKKDLLVPFGLEKKK